MGLFCTRILATLVLLLALPLEAQLPTNPVLRRRALPARVGPNAMSGHDRADLRHEWDLFWFGGKLSPDYMDFKNRAAAAEVQKWGHLLPKVQTGGAQGAQALAAIQTAAGSGGVTWSNLGPTTNVTDASWTSIDSGRPVAIVPHPTTTTTLYLATSGGGVFKCTNADLNAAGDWTWTPMTDALPASGSGGNVSIGAMAISADGGTLFVGAGDPFDAEGRGFYKSPDGGATWTAATGLGVATRSYAILPLTTTRILWGTNDGLKISNDGGATFTAATGGPAAGSVWTVRKFSATELACSVKPASAGAAGQIYTSNDSGATWILATVSGASFPMGRITLAAAGDGTTAFGIVEDTTTSSTVVAKGVLKSADKGATWTWVAAPTIGGGLFQGPSGDGGQGWYNHALGVDPSNANRLVVGANLALYRSMDGGASWTQLTHWTGNGHPYTHADNHATAWSGGTLFVANDGGLAILRDPWRATVPTTTEDLGFVDNRRNKGLATHLLYSVGSTTASTPADSKWRVTMGLQDNGTRVRQGSGAALQTSGSFEDQIGGDGFGTLIHPTNGDLMLGSLYYTRIYKSTNGGATQFSPSSAGITESNDKNLAPFSPKIVPGDAGRPNTVYTSTNGKVYQSLDFGGSWSVLSTSGLPAPLDTSVTGATTNLFIRNLNAARGDANALGITGNQSRVYLSYNGGSSWTQAAALPGSSSSLSYLWFDRTSSTTLYVASVAPVATANHLWKSTNGGGSWTAIDGSASTSNGFPFGIPVHVVQTDPLNAATIYAGTDFGVYVSGNGGTSWTRFGSGLPLVATRDLYVAPDGTFLRAATFGRGVWEAQLPVGPVVSLDKTTFNLNPSASTTLTATVTNFATDNKVNWTVSTGGGTETPTQTASGVATTYTAPATPGIYTVTAASNELSSSTASATVNVYTAAAVAVSVTPTTKTLITGGTVTFAAIVTNAPSQAVTWTASSGTITSGGVYTAPATPGTYTITATSIWPNTTPGTASVAVKTLDLNGDGSVDLRDLLTIAKSYNTANATCDLNGDGLVDDADLAILLAGL